jgi:hypothetical protein
MTKSGFVPSPWYVCFEFFRVIGIAFVATLGRHGAPIRASHVATRTNAWAAKAATATGRPDGSGIEYPYKPTSGASA